jgi:peroxiredoxin
MARLKKGQALPDFAYDTPFKKGIRLSEAAKLSHKTALIFLRYYGCTLCRYDIHRLAQDYADIVSGGGNFLVVLQSDPEKLAAQIAPEGLPFEIICDPQAALYKRFDILPAGSKARLADIKTVAKVAKAMAAGFKHGDYEGDELQLPAVFAIKPDLTLSYVKYGKSAGDIPDARALKEILK